MFTVYRQMHKPYINKELLVTVGSYIEVLLNLLLITLTMDHVDLCQGWGTCGPWAKCGPRE